MPDSETHRIKALLEGTFKGKPWHGPSVMEVLAALTIEETLNQIVDSHTINELVEHMIAWRQFTIKKMEGDVDYEVTPEINFRSISTITEKDWQATLERLRLTQEALVKLVGAANDAKLQETVPGREYTYYTLLHGIIQHDLYHLGQIVLMRKL